MLRLTFWYEPEGFGFYIRDSSATVATSESTARYVETNRLLAMQGVIDVAVKSEYSVIPITVEYDSQEVFCYDFEKWDRVVECPLDSRSGGIYFESLIGDKFGYLEVPPGNYRLRIHYGGQSIGHPDGETEDFYLIQIWPSDETDIRVLKS